MGLHVGPGLWRSGTTDVKPPADDAHTDVRGRAGRGYDGTPPAPFRRRPMSGVVPGHRPRGLPPAALLLFFIVQFAGEPGVYESLVNPVVDPLGQQVVSFVAFAAIDQGVGVLWLRRC